MIKQIATFSLGETLFGVDVLLVKEVYRHMVLTPVPDAPSIISGLMNLRGKVVTVIDLNSLLNRPVIDTTEDSRLLIFKTDSEIKVYIKNGRLTDEKLGEDIFGFLIDSMNDVLEVDEDKILPPPPNLDDVESDLIGGVLKMGEKLVILLDVTAVLKKISDFINNDQKDE